MHPRHRQAGYRTYQQKKLVWLSDQSRISTAVEDKIFPKVLKKKTGRAQRSASLLGYPALYHPFHHLYLSPPRCLALSVRTFWQHMGRNARRSNQGPATPMHFFS